MAEQEPVPAHLQELLEPTASGTDKLLAAWGGLAVETKILLWRALYDTGHPAHLHERIRDCALGDGNAYVRYLAARQLEIETRGQLTHSLTEDDPSELVRYAHWEDELEDIGDGPLKDPARFFALPRSARLARIRCLREGGEEIAAILLHGTRELLPSNTVTELELAEITGEFVQNAFVRHRAHEPPRLGSDGYAEFLMGEGMEALWRAIPELPEEGAAPLVDHLPDRHDGLSCIPDEVLDTLPPRLFTKLLFRRDVELQRRRKRLALDATQDGALTCAAAANLHLTDDELALMLVAPGEVDEEVVKAEPRQDNVAGRLRLLERFAVCGGGLEPVQLLAIADVFYAMPRIGVKDPGDKGDLAWIGYEREARRAAERGDMRCVDRVRLYQSARFASNWRSEEVHEFPEPLQQLGVIVAPGNPWTTYMRLRDTDALYRSDITSALRTLVWLDELGEDPPHLEFCQ